MGESSIDEGLSFYSCTGGDEGEGKVIVSYLVRDNDPVCRTRGDNEWNDTRCHTRGDNEWDDTRYHILPVDMLGIENLISQIDLVLLNKPITCERGRKRARAAVVSDKSDDTLPCINATDEKSAVTDTNTNELTSPIILDDVEEDSFVFDLDEIDELYSLGEISSASSNSTENTDFNAIISDAGGTDVGGVDRIDIFSNEFIEIDESLCNENILPNSIYPLPSETCYDGEKETTDLPHVNSTTNDRVSRDELRVAIERDSSCMSAATDSHDSHHDVSRESDEESILSVMSMSSITIPCIEIPPPSVIAPPTINEVTKRVIKLSSDMRKYRIIDSRVKSTRHQAPGKSTHYTISVKKSDVHNASLNWYNTNKGREYSLDHDENIKPTKGFEKPTIASKSRIGYPRIVTQTPSCTTTSAVIIASNIVKTVI